MGIYSRPLVLVHGLWDDPRIFNKLIDSLQKYDVPFFAPHLPHRYGKTSLRTLARQLDCLIYRQFGSNVSIDLLGFSMGGVIIRIWLQELLGNLRTSRFLSVGSPHKGTLSAQFVPSMIAEGLADMKRGSELLRDLNRDFSALSTIKNSSYFCWYDLMVFPGWDAVLPLGTRYAVPVLTHKDLILHPIALDMLVKEIINV